MWKWERKFRISSVFSLVRKFISALKQVRNEYFYLLKGLKNCLPPLYNLLRMHFKLFWFPTAYKRPFHAFVNKIRCVTRKEKLFQTRGRCLQHFSLSLPSVPSILNRVRHLTLARNSSFCPLGAQCTISQLRHDIRPFSREKIRERKFRIPSVFYENGKKYPLLYMRKNAIK